MTMLLIVKIVTGSLTQLYYSCCVLLAIMIALSALTNIILHFVCQVTQKRLLKGLHIQGH